MQVQLIRRWSNTPARTVVDVDDVQGQWLLDHGFGTHAGDTRSHEEVEGALQPTHITGVPATSRARVEDGHAGAVDGAPDAVHNAHTAADDKQAKPAARRRRNAD